VAHRERKRLLPPSKPFTLKHFSEWAAKLTLDTGDPWIVEKWQLDPIRDLFKGLREVWLIVPEGNAKTTLAAGITLYYLEHSEMASIPVAASSREQAEVLYRQAEGFVIRSDAMHELMDDPNREARGKRAMKVPRFECQEGYRRIKHFGGSRMQVYAADDRTGDGVIPTFCVVDELHRHRDLRLYRTWRGKLDKRGGQILAISTAGEPETEFENTRDRLRGEAKDRKRKKAYVRAASDRVVLHEYMLEEGCEPDDFKAVERANPLKSITAAKLKAKFNDPTQELNEWMRLVCNRPTRTIISAITEMEWEDAQIDKRVPHKAPVLLGFDAGWKWDTTAIQPLWVGPDYRLLLPPKVLVPPRDGSQMHPDEIKNALLELNEEFSIDTMVMDMHRAEEIAAWCEDDLGWTVIDHGVSNPTLVADYDAFMGGLRNGTLKHTGDHEQRRQVLNAIARRLPGGDYRFDRSSTTRGNVREQDRRVIDVLSAASMVVEHSNRLEPELSVYEKRALVAA
jgi:hypothetical protein